MSRKRKSALTAAAQVGFHLMRDRIAGSKPTTLADIPASAARITPEWLTQVLCRDVAGARVTATQIIGQNRGTHERSRIAVVYNEAGTAAGLPPTIFVKTLATLATRMLVGFMGHARYEMLFYKLIRPELTIETPRCYHSASDKRTFAAIHVLEDLVATKGAVFGDETTRLSRAQAFDMVDLLAALHGRFHESDRFSGDLNWLVNYYDWFRSGAERVHTERFHRKALSKAADFIPLDIRARRTEIWPATVRVLETHRSGPLTVIHSDVHIGNWYRTREGRVGIFDWQCVNTGHWSRDVSYALATCLTIEDRRAWERELLQHYLVRRAEYGQHLDEAESWNHYRRQMLHALTMWTQTLCHPIFQPTSQTDALTYELLRRITTAMSDLETLDALDT